MNLTLLRDLRAALADLREYEARLTARETTPELLRELDQSVLLVRRLVAAVGRVPVTGCRIHPDGPVDVAGGGCLLCNSRRHRAAPARPGPAGDAPVELVLAAIEEHGQDTAARRYGPRSVTRALAAAGRGTTTNLAPQHGQENDR
ncbi:hypothetical protein [Streptomyces fuscigenes]|uniref:hypothetical protein n=1 Tax=Streptomyces fuscigenes TaxID=1528880 RepID=UPI001F30E52F|nr:hypothetical protein [Streptomyces fuscigenes]MCF3960325.1 hypothetical protein [Streptomyces fuscigenes]